MPVCKLAALHCAECYNWRNNIFVIHTCSYKNVRCDILLFASEHLNCVQFVNVVYDDM